MWIASGEDELHGSDRVSLIGSPEAVTKARGLFVSESERRAKQRIMIAGGGETGYHLADSLSRRDYRIVLLERDQEHCNRLAKILPDATVSNLSPADATETPRTISECSNKRVRLPWAMSHSPTPSRSAQKTLVPLGDVRRSKAFVFKISGGAGCTPWSCSRVAVRVRDCIGCLTELCFAVCATTGARSAQPSKTENRTSKFWGWPFIARSRLSPEVRAS